MTGLTLIGGLVGISAANQPDGWFNLVLIFLLLGSVSRMVLYLFTFDFRGLRASAAIFANAGIISYCLYMFTQKPFLSIALGFGWPATFLFLGLAEHGLEERVVTGKSDI